MNRRRLISAAAVLLLTAGGVAAGIAPADAAPTPGVNLAFFAAAVVPADAGGTTGSSRETLAATGATPTGPAAPLAALGLFAGAALLVLARRRRRA